MNNKKFSPKKKERTKVIRSIFQGIILIIAFTFIIKALLTFSIYKPYEVKASPKDNGFIAISYFGVDRTGDETLISTSALEKQIKSLKDNGYVTVTQNDILDYYKKGKNLPEKSLFLLFEDGRRDTAIFSQKILEKYNYKATMLNYADKFSKKDFKFLMPEDLLELKDSSYWELGTNGYRLEYINVFDKDSNYLGELNSVDFSKLSPKIDREYNHYLMDYIRDKHGIPKETYDEMEKRINYDYEKLSNIYNESLGDIPSLYVLMHSNTGQFGTNNKVSKINEKWIKKLFTMNFNREGYSLNMRNSSTYDLTRIQPQAYWSTNHLLMRIWDDTKKDVDFVTGDNKKASAFKEIKGQAEFLEDKIILTSCPKENGTIKLLNSENYKDIKVSTRLQGNVIGSQAIYLRANEDRSNAICIELSNDVLKISENLNGSKKTLYSLNLNNKVQTEKIDIKKQGNKKLDVELVKDSLTLSLDDKKIVENLKVENENKGSIFLQSSWGEYGYSKRNIADDVYDGIFKGFKVSDINDKILYDSSLKGMDAVVYNVKNYSNKVVNWFIKNL